MLHPQENDLVQQTGQESQINQQPEAQPADEIAKSIASAGVAADAVPSRYAEAGRKGARRVHQLIQAGRQYEQEHGLKRGRQRLRQLIELGKLYEQEHGLRIVRPTTLADQVAQLSEEETLQLLLHSLVRLVKPQHRARLLEMVRGLEGVSKELPQAS